MFQNYGNVVCKMGISFTLMGTILDNVVNSRMLDVMERKIVAKIPF
jgi:hypothetical protein